MECRQKSTFVRASATGGRCNLAQKLQLHLGSHRAQSQALLQLSLPINRRGSGWGEGGTFSSHTDHQLIATGLHMGLATGQPETTHPHPCSFSTCPEVGSGSWPNNPWSLSSQNTESELLTTGLQQAPQCRLRGCSRSFCCCDK